MLRIGTSTREHIHVTQLQTRYGSLLFCPPESGNFFEWPNSHMTGSMQPLEQVTKEKLSQFCHVPVRP